MDSIIANQKNFVENLKNIIDFLTCPVCENLLQNPLALPGCQHRFCETCIVNSNQNDLDLKCLVCSLEFSRTDIQPQNQLEGYIENLKTLIEKLNQEKQLRKSVSGLYEFCCRPKIKKQSRTSADVEKNHENINPNVTKEADQSNLFEKFDPKICSTTIKPKKAAKLVSLENSLISTNDNKQLKFFADDTIIEEEPENQDESTVGKKSILTTDIEMIPDSQFAQPEIPIFRQDRSQFKDMHSQEEIIVDVNKSILTDPAEQSSYQTQSQYHVLKSTITYEHKKLDKFDLVINSTKNTAHQNDSNNNSNQQDCKNDEEDAFLMKTMDSTVSTEKSNVSASVEFLLDSDSDDEELMTSVWEF